MPKNVRIDTRQSAIVLDSASRKQWCFPCVTEGVGWGACSFFLAWTWTRRPL